MDCNVQSASFPPEGGNTHGNRILYGFRICFGNVIFIFHIIFVVLNITNDPIVNDLPQE